MKKIMYMITVLVLLAPVKVLAIVSPLAPDVDIFADQTTCVAELSHNNDNSNVKEGYYLTCVEVKCQNNVITHNDLAPLASNVTCSNGNKNPFAAVRDSKANGDLSAGHACDSATFTTTYSTVKYQFECTLNAGGGNYSPTANNNTTTSPTANSNNGTTNNPQTGINTYYLILGTTVTALSVALYIVNKKNLFKKI